MDGGVKHGVAFELAGGDRPAMAGRSRGRRFGYLVVDTVRPGGRDGEHRHRVRRAEGQAGEGRPESRGPGTDASSRRQGFLSAPTTSKRKSVTPASVPPYDLGTNCDAGNHDRRAVSATGTATFEPKDIKCWWVRGTATAPVVPVIRVDRVSWWSSTRATTRCLRRLGRTRVRRGSATRGRGGRGRVGTLLLPVSSGGSRSRCRVRVRCPWRS